MTAFSGIEDKDKYKTIIKNVKNVSYFLACTKDGKYQHYRYQFYHYDYYHRYFTYHFGRYS